MLPTQILDRFVERCPAGVMVRAALERLLRPERLDQIFEDASQRQYTLGRQSLSDQRFFKRSKVGYGIAAEAAAQRPHRLAPLQ